MKKIIKIITLVVISALIISAFTGCQSARQLTKDTTVSTQNQNYDSTTVEVINPEDVDWNFDGTEFKNNDELINILLIGQDRREGESRQRSDAMILCSFNPQTNKMAMISFLRDLYVQIPGYDDNRLNAAYAYGGFDLLKETLEHNFGISVDGCFEADFESFEKIIDAVDGVKIELTSEEASIVGGGATEGICSLNGEQALKYARIRKIDSDFHRTARQRKIMSAVFEKAKGYSLTELAMFFSEIMPLMATDMTDDEIMSLAFSYAASFSELKTESYIVPAEGTYKNAMIREMAVLLPDLEEIRKLIFEEYLPL